jgi:hypothetical protein
MAMRNETAFASKKVFLLVKMINPGVGLPVDWPVFPGDGS